MEATKTATEMHLDNFNLIKTRILRQKSIVPAVSFLTASCCCWLADFIDVDSKYRHVGDTVVSHFSVTRNKIISFYLEIYYNNLLF